jgi:hypothetical protein
MGVTYWVWLWCLLLFKSGNSGWIILLDRWGIFMNDLLGLGFSAAL